VILGEEDFAKYPFLEEARSYVSQLGLTLNDMCSPEFERIIKRCEARLKSSRYPLELYIIDKDSDLLSFILAVVVIKASQREDFFSRFALNEASRAEAFLKTENKKTITYIIRQLLGASIYEMEYSIGDSYYEYAMEVKEYVSFSASMKSDYWRIVNRILNDGFVYLRRNEIVRLARDKARQEIFKRIRDAPTPNIPTQLQYLVDIIRNRPLPRRYYEETRIINYPPCAKHALAKMGANENLAHFERFFLTAYLLKAGKTVEDIMKYLATSPDFNEKIARYQVEHIAGLRGGRKAYNVPDCKTLFSQSLCFKDETCDNISHPLQYGRRVKGSEGNFDKKGSFPKKNV
jgi:DNA primase large subunit